MGKRARFSKQWCGLNRWNNESGIALIIVVSVLAIAGIMAVSFAFTQRLELKAAANFQLSVKAGYLAEAGVRHAIQLLEEDKSANAYDAYTETWSTTFQGEDCDNDGEGRPDSRWIDFVEEPGGFLGRYAVLVRDEAGEINLNSAGFHNTSPLKVTEGWQTFEVSLEKFLDLLHVPNAKTVSSAVLDYRYGGEIGLKNGQPGKDDDGDGMIDETGYPGVDDPSVDDNNNSVVLAYDGIDNDADGIRDESGEGVNEPMEFDPLDPYSDDRVFISLEQLKGVEGINEQIFQNLRRFLGTNSVDKEVDSLGNNRVSLNNASADQLYKVFRDAGVGSPARKAVNLKDWLDADCARTSLSEVIRTFSVSDEGPKGDWEWEGDRYVSHVPGGNPGWWQWSGIESGNYYLTFFAQKEGQIIGDVTINNQTCYNLKHGDQFVGSLSNSITIGSDGMLSIQIQNNRQGAETECVFHRVQLEPLVGAPSGFQSVPVHGVEPIRINELLVSPVTDLGVRQDQDPGGDWVWTGSFYTNHQPKGATAGEGTWEWRDIPNGTYYVELFGAGSGQTVGDVQIKGKSKTHVHSGDRFPYTITVSGGMLSIDIQNNETEGECVFSRIRLSQQPDGEFIELVNIGEEPISVGGWVIEGPGPDGWPATIPLETEPILPSGYLILAMDLDDNQAGVNGNGISLNKNWSGLTSAVQLQFTNTVSETGDLLTDSPGQIVRLKNEKGQIVDEVEYLSVSANQSLECADPADSLDANLNGTRDGFYASADENRATPGQANKNGAMIKEYDEFGNPTYHDVHKEVQIRNRPIPNLDFLSGVPLGGWSHWSLDDLAWMVDKVTLHAVRLEAEGHSLGLSGWSEVQQASPLTNLFRSLQAGEVGEWRWDEKDHVKNGYYFLRILGEPEQAVEVSIQLADGTWTEYTPALVAGSDGGMAYGVIAIGAGTVLSTPKQILQIRLRNASSLGAATFDYLLLEPALLIPGRININTAETEVLQSLPGIDQEVANQVIEGRPYGDQGGLRMGIGDLVTSGVLKVGSSESNDVFATLGRIANLVTVRSDHFEIIATGQWLRKGVILAEKRIRAVVER